MYFSIPSPLLLDSPVSIDQILTMTSKLARIRFALVNLRLAQVARVPRITLTRETVLSIDTGSPVTRIRGAVVDVRFAGQSRVPRRTLAGIASDRILTDSVILAGL